MSESARVEVAIAAPARDVWAALRERDRLRTWFGWDHEGLDDEIEEIFFAGATACEAQRTLDTGGGRFALDESGAGTVLRVWREDPDGGWDGRFDGIDQGWLTFVQQLRFALERRPRGARRTLHLTGTPQVLAAPPLDELGLAGVGLLDAGAPYATVLAPGERADGEVFFSGHGQLGLTVSGYGEGLLVLFGDWTGEPPYGRVAMIASTFGLDEARLAALEHRWARWWWAHHARD